MNFFARFVVVWTLVTRIPLPKSCWPDNIPDGDKCLSLIPLAGGIAGLLTGIVAALLNLAGIGHAASAWCAAAFYAAVGWGLHLDGWGDLWDGVGSGRRGEELRSVMKDSRLGAYGAIGLIIAFGLWTSLLSSCRPGSEPVVLMTAAASGRFSICVAAFFGDYPWESGMGKGWVDTFTSGDLFTAALCSLVFAPFAPSAWLFSMAAAALTGYSAARVMNARLGGVNGDVLGAVAVAAEILSIMVIVL